MKLHPRYQLVARAKNRLSEVALAIIEEHDATPIEMVGILITLAQDFQRLALRIERHVDTDTKADEEGERRYTRAEVLGLGADETELDALD